MSNELPAGIEWPKFEGGGLVLPGSEFAYTSGDVDEVCTVDFGAKGFRLYGGSSEEWYDYGTRIKRPPVLDADGVLIEIGDTVWYVNQKDSVIEGPEKVIRIEKPPCESPIVWTSLNGDEKWSYCHDLTHNPPDSWEQLEEDILKDTMDYWGCTVLDNCSTCPAAKNGETPSERYNVRTCGAAGLLDIIRRAKKLAGVE